MLIGVLSGVVLLLLLRTAFSSPNLTLRVAFRVIAQLLALPAFWFGGPWLTTKLLASVKPEQIRSSYTLTLVTTFGLLAVIPVYQLVIRVGNDIRRPDGDPK